MARNVNIGGYTITDTGVTVNVPVYEITFTDVSWIDDDGVLHSGQTVTERFPQIIGEFLTLYPQATKRRLIGLVLEMARIKHGVDTPHGRHA